MKNKILLSGLCLSIAAFIFNACSKSDDSNTSVPTNNNNNVTGDCNIREIRFNGVLRLQMEYDAQGRLSVSYSIGDNAKPESTIKYIRTSTTVLEITSDANSLDTNIYTLGSNGYASKMVNGKDTTYYEYDGNGYMIKETDRYSILTNTYSNGNRIKQESKSKVSGDVSYTVSYEYSSHANPVKYEDASGLTGKGTKKLVLKESTTYLQPTTSTNVSQYNYTKYDGKGNPTSFTLTQIEDGVNTGTINFDLTWICK